MSCFVSPGRRTTVFIRFLVFLLIVAAVNPSAFAQSIEGRVPDEKLQATPQVLQSQGALSDPLEGPIDPATYVLGPSDQLLVLLKGPETAMNFLRIFPEGNVILPNYGSFRASGLTLKEFGDRVREVLRRYYRNVDIDVQLSVPRRFVVYVLGEVNSPGPVVVTALSRVSHAIGRAGGLRDGGSSRLIEIREYGKEPRRVDQFMFLHTGDFEQNPTLTEGQTLYVPLREITVNVIGEVRKGGQYEIVEGETAAELFEYCGGLGPLASPGVIIRERIAEGKAQPVFKFAMQDAATVVLADLDVFIVDNVMSYDGDEPVQVIGGGGRTGVFQIREPEPLREFLLRLWRIEPTTYNLDKAVLERPVGDGTSSQTEFSIRAVLAGDTTVTLMVRPGDNLVIPPAVTQVYLAGQVNAPGPVPFQPGLTAEQYVTLAGGPNDSGSYGKLKIVSLEGVERDANEESVVHRGDTIVVGTRTSRKFGALWVGVISLTGLVVALVALSNSLNQ